MTMQIGVGDEPHCQSGDRLQSCFFRSIGCIPHGIRRVLRVSKPLNVLHKVKRHHAPGDRAMTSGFEMTSRILTSPQTHSIQ